MSRAPQHGFSIVELMVALTIGLLITLAMSSAFLSGSASKSSNVRTSEIETNGRYAIDFLKRELQHSGFVGLGGTTVTLSGTTGTTDYGCGAGVVTNLQQPVWGSNDSNPFSGSCIPATNYLAGDVLVLRRAGLASIPSATALSATTLYVRTEYLGATVYLGPTRPSFFQPPVEDYPLQTDVYYVAPFTTSASESPKVPALWRLTLGTGPALTAQMVASGVENMQVQYAVTTSAGTRYLNANDVAATEWPSVTGVRVWLLVRSTNSEPDLSNTSTYTLGDQTITASDSYPRQVFPLVVNLRN
jgi:type IV pilus assembly protein PilW